MSKNIRPMDSTPVDMYEAESFERLIQGLKVSASCALEMHKREPEDGWDKCAESLKALIVGSRKLMHAEALTRQALLDDAARIQGKLDTSLSFS